MKRSDGPRAGLRTSLKRLAAVALLGLAVGAIRAPATRAESRVSPESYPVRTLYIVVPYGPGGGVDTLARGIANFLPRYLDVNVVVVNWEGAGTRIAASRFQNTKADGSYLFITAQPDTILGQVVFQGQYDVKSWVPVYSFSSDRPFLAVKADGPYQTLDELVSAMRSKRLLYANTGNADSFHLQSAILRKALGVQFTLVPFRGTSSALAAVVGGNADFTIANIQNYFQTSNVKALALFGSGPDSRLPGVKSMADLGYKVDAVITTRGLSAPPGLPAQLKTKLERAFAKVASDPEFQAWARQVGFVLEPLNSQQWSERIDHLFALATEYESLLREDMRMQ